MAAGSADADLCQSATARPDRAISDFIRAAETESQISSSISACLVLGRDGEQHEPGGHLPGGRRLSWAPMHQIWTPARFWARARSALVVVVVVRRPSFVPSFVYHPSRLLTSHFPFSFSSASCLIGVRLGALISYVVRRSDVPSGLVLAASRAGSEQSDDEPTKVAPTPAPVVLPRKSRFADEDVEQKADSDVRPPLLAHSLDPRSLPYDQAARGACARPVEPGEGREGRVLGLAVLCRLTYPGPLARALQDDWDASSADEATKKASATPAVAAAAPRKKGNLKAKLAEKAAQEEERKKAVRTRPPNLSSSRPAQSRCCVRIGTADKYGVCGLRRAPGPGQCLAPTSLTPGSRCAPLSSIVCLPSAQILAGKIEDVGLELTPQERRRLEKQQEIEADLANAADLLGAASVEGASSSRCRNPGAADQCLRSRCMLTCAQFPIIS
jgi:hypothetical protein